MTDLALYSIAQIRAFEHAACVALPAGTLMGRAARAAADHALALLAGAPPEPAVLVLVGPGNNGGDALWCATLLREAGCAVTLALAGDPAAFRGETVRAWQAARALPQLAPAALAGRRWALVIDGLFGIGLTRPITGTGAALVEQVNAMDCPCLALDVPSGLNADTGALIGGCAIRATHTLTFIGDKPGLHTADGGDHAGQVAVTALDVDAHARPAPALRRNDPALFATQLRARMRNTHKGSFGSVAVLGGADGMGGAPLLAARAALCCGVGRVHVGFAGRAPAFDPLHPELMCGAAAELDLAAHTLVLGPGLATGAGQRALLARALATPQALVLDADALNLLAADAALQNQLVARSGATVLTPHPLEAARLLGADVATVQADRPASARRLATRFGAAVVLKGYGSVIAQADGELVINPTGNPGLATAGSGDVLAGMCGALLAQRWPLREAALGAVWLHGAAADRLVAQGIGPVGLCASELPGAARGALNALIAR